MNNLIKRYNKPIRIRLLGELLTRTTEAMLAIIFIVHVNKALEGNVILTMLLFGLQPLSDIVFTLIAGGVTDRYGRKKIMLLGLFVQAIAIGGFVFAESVAFFALLYMMNGIGRSLYIPAQRAQIADLTKQEKQAEIFAVLQTVGAIGAVIGPLLGAFFYNSHPKYLFIIQAVALLLYAVLVWTQLPETAPMIQTNERLAQVTTRKQFIFRHYAVFGLMLSTLPISFFYAQTETNYRVFAENIFPNFLFVLAFISTCKAIMEIILQVGLVKCSERFSMPKIIVISYIFYTLAAIGYGYSTTLWSLFFTLLFLTIGESIALNHLLRFVSRIAPSHNRGLYFSIYGIHWDISRTCGPVIGAFVLNHLSGSTLFYICACLLIIGGTIQTYFVYSVERNKSKELSL
ncbi:MDR family MFS transporter [Bacillus gaemokensis]|uniref:MFS transporter n=1 Tax=Bacillus gaemokensis TaxID=574375 RepID=A0A073KH69_9BACI|nr:MFS transporter [Bacillus gaemokensis]KEK21673.1 MFS transporter [Bacillus gaemokensis]KYG34738.1 MFS transporter [Bacillus gaemokensis]